MQHLSEDGALFPSVVLGSVLVAVCGQTLQAFTQTFTILHFKLLQTFTCKYVSALTQETFKPIRL